MCGESYVGCVPEAPSAGRIARRPGICRQGTFIVNPQAQQSSALSGEVLIRGRGPGISNLCRIHAISVTRHARSGSLSGRCSFAGRPRASRSGSGTRLLKPRCRSSRSLRRSNRLRLRGDIECTVPSGSPVSGHPSRCSRSIPNSEARLTTSAMSRSMPRRSVIDAVRLANTIRQIRSARNAI